MFSIPNGANPAGMFGSVNWPLKKVWEAKALSKTSMVPAWKFVA